MTFKFSIEIPREVTLPDESLGRVTRDVFYEWLWQRFSSEGLEGVHEGTLLCDQAAAEGLEADAWTVDSGEAPRDRDWVGHQEQTQADLFFASEVEAGNAVSLLQQIPEIVLGPLEEQKQQDWDAEWKASFLNAGEGVPIPPFWRVVPPWVDTSPSGSVEPQEIFLKINPGAGFGTGTHETTQLCLEALGKASQLNSFKNQRALDFGSGSGILAIALAQLGAQVNAVEVDSMAIDNAIENAALNGVEGKIAFATALAPEMIQCRVVVANILKPVLLEFAHELVQRLDSKGTLVLSGLIEKDVQPVLEKYAPLLKSSPQIFEKSEWRAIVFNSP